MNRGIGNFVFSIFLPGAMLTFGMFWTAMFIGNDLTHWGEGLLLTGMWCSLLYLGLNIARGLFLDFCRSQGRGSVPSVRDALEHFYPSRTRERQEPRGL